jgi:lipoyl-dependent peroxiredoxin
MRQEHSYTTAATAMAGEATRVRSDDGRLELALSTPTELGGPGGDGTNAEQLLASGYAACFFSALQYAAARSAELRRR